MHFIATKDLTCLYGCGDVAYGGTVGNFKKHVYKKYKVNIVSTCARTFRACKEPASFSGNGFCAPWGEPGVQSSDKTLYHFIDAAE